MVEFFNSFGTDRITGSTVAVGFVFFIMCIVILILLKIDKYISVKINESELSIRLKMLEEERNSKEKQDPYFYIKNIGTNYISGKNSHYFLL